MVTLPNKLRCAHDQIFMQFSIMLTSVRCIIFPCRFDTNFNSKNNQKFCRPGDFIFGMYCTIRVFHPCNPKNLCYIVVHFYSWTFAKGIKKDSKVSRVFDNDSSQYGLVIMVSSAYCGILNSWSSILMPLMLSFCLTARASASTAIMNE